MNINDLNFSKPVKVLVRVKYSKDQDRIKPLLVKDKLFQDKEELVKELEPLELDLSKAYRDKNYPSLPVTTLDGENVSIIQEYLERKPFLDFEQ
ncbi:hypothetical protein [Jeotgalicoccus psychrophilus]|uniref:hypothetical protein n=1 Tax=Jeotgalicoccus psychrophilus TaxID=157228 RepID=UPI00047B8B30|nr:hypothetical protein [Jeotgalicoccus psychrophilus]